MNTLLQCAMALLILGCIGPGALVVTTRFLTKRRKRSLLTDAASAGVMFFVVSIFFVFAYLSRGISADNSYACLIPPTVGILGFLMSLVSLNVRYNILLGYKTYDEYLEGEAQRAARWAEKSEKCVGYLKDWKHHVKEWARRMWSGWYP